jgi:hypothetical protein
VSVSGLHSHIKGNKFLSNVFSNIDKGLFREYNVTYCTYEKNKVFVIILSDCFDDVMKTKWDEVKSHCLDNGIDLEFDIITEDDYKHWVNDLFPTHKILENGYLSINDR